MSRRIARKPDGIDGLNFNALQANIRWSGLVWMDQLGYAESSMLSMTKWPVKSGPDRYACVTTGLLFDTESGRCLQSSMLHLKLDTIVPAKMSKSELLRWVKERQTSDVKFGRYTLKEESDAEE